jgi:two-component system phosphate regulon sensor histidine kinase PhoR
VGFRGVLVRTSRLNDISYLTGLAKSVAAEEAGSALALGDQDGVLADTGTGVPAAEVAKVAKAALISGGVERIIGNRFVAARPVPNETGGGPVLAVVLSAPRTLEDAARQDLFRVLFLVALGSATAALALAGFAGERLGAGLRRLTDAASAIQGGDLDARADIDTEDELGMLGRSFNAMAASLGGLTADLRTAALDEATLRGRLEAVVGGMGEALVAVDGDGQVTDFNAAAEELFDLPARKARGRPIGEVVRMRTADGTDLARRLRRPVLEGWNESGAIRLADGGEVPVAISAGTLRGTDNEVVGAVFVLRDERREAELERMKTEFLANISHELRTPLTPIKGFASILQTRDLPPAKAHGFAEEISVAADQLERVISQLVNFATIVGGRLSIDPHPVPVRPLIDRTLKPWRTRLAPSHKVVRRVASGIPDVVADSTYLAQALDELLDNAVKYSPDGGRIVVSADVVDGEDGAELEISVRDEGVGIAADRLDSVLVDFTQGDASSTRRFGGLGLGLSLVHRIANAHGGDLRVDSVPDEGTTVTMVLPVRGPGTGSSR